MYRALANLNTGKGIIEKGCAFSKRSMAPAVAEKLMAAGKLVEVNAPPLAQIPLMKAHVNKLKKASVVDADAFVDADPQELVGVMKLDVEQISRLQNSICRMLDAPDPRTHG